MEHKFSDLLPPNWETKIDEWLQEDIPSFDYGGFVVGRLLRFDPVPVYASL
jgi:nicotinate-nucleotide pyrophosphorylase (carboxylating)